MKAKQEAIKRAQIAIDKIRNGEMVILVDDEDRENEGDLVIASDHITPEAITFMATKGCGLICVTMTPEQVDQLQLAMMVQTNQASLGTAFTVSIEAAQGVSTGISAADRAHTIKVAANPDAKPADLVSPGHIFPLRAQPGGVLQRTGQTEGSVDLARLAGLNPSGVICEIMKQDGTMARMDDLKEFASEYNLEIVSVADMIEYRLQHDRLVERVNSYQLELGTKTQATFDVHVYEAVPGISRQEYVALTLGDVASGDPVPVRAHVGNISDDLLGASFRKDSPSLLDAIDAIVANGRGAILYLPSRETIDAQLNMALNTASQNQHDIREYGIGAQLLLDLGIRDIQVISNNPHKLVALRAWGFETTQQISLKEVIKND